MNKFLVAIIWVLMSVVAVAKDVPISNGQYVFIHRFSEHPNMPSIKLNVKIEGKYIELVNMDDDSLFPFGVIASGELFWHTASGKWIIVTSPEDKEAKEVGGCSDGPEVVDLEKKIYWTC